MAIDTAEKRRSAGSTPAIPAMPGVTPNALKDVQWRAESGWGYSGLHPDPPSGGGGSDEQTPGNTCGVIRTMGVAGFHAVLGSPIGLS